MDDVVLNCEKCRNNTPMKFGDTETKAWVEFRNIKQEIVTPVLGQFSLKGRPLKITVDVAPKH